MPGIDYDRDLNPEQRAAALAPDGPVLVIAAAGTGKTRTLTYRVAHLVERGVDPYSVLLLTFTNRAAQEMMTRARGLVGESVGGVWGGTFHHVANRILRRHADRLGYRNDYTILDEEDARSLVRKSIDQLNLRDAHFPKPDVLLSLFGLAQSREAPLETTAAKHFREGHVDVSDLARVEAAYTQHKQTLNAMDFDDLLVLALRLLRENPDILQRYQDRFVHVLVDEYQDTNTLQARLVDALAGRHRNLLVVGDDFQSIYSWRGADYRNFLSFPERYPGTQVFKLETNYRSVPGILQVANACIAGNPEQFQKTLHAVRTDGVRPFLVELRDGGGQARYIVEKIALLRREGLRLGDIAVLYRSHFHAMELQLELSRENLPYAITSGIRFFEQAHIKDALALLRLAHNPTDEIAFTRLLGLFPRVGEKTTQRLWREAGNRFSPMAPACWQQVGTRLPALARDDWNALAALFADAEKDGLTSHPGECVDHFISGYYGVYAEKTYENYERRLEDLEELVNFIGRFGSVGDFLNEVALLTNVDAGGAQGAEPKEGEAVLLSTVHQAKGLEWKTVFVLWLAEGLFPSGRSMEDQEGLAEERRLFYVAVTRAKDSLYLCAPRMRRIKGGDAQYYSPSRFLSEVPRDLLRRERYEPSDYSYGRY